MPDTGTLQIGCVLVHKAPDRLLLRWRVRSSFATRAKSAIPALALIAIPLFVVYGVALSYQGPPPPPTHTVIDWIASPNGLRVLVPIGAAFVWLLMLILALMPYATYEEVCCTRLETFHRNCIGPATFHRSIIRAQDVISIERTPLARFLGADNRWVAREMREGRPTIRITTGGDPVELGVGLLPDEQDLVVDSVQEAWLRLGVTR